MDELEEQLSGRRVLITGGSSGISRTVAEHLGRNGTRAAPGPGGHERLVDAGSPRP